MFVYKRNHHIEKNFRYDSDDVDLFSPMFDESLHNNSIGFACLHPKMCMYCHTLFPSRNKLFHHLGFMNIDIGAQFQNIKEERERQKKLRKRRWSFSPVKRIRKRRNYKSQLARVFTKLII